jgi:hypothetical protein
MDEETNMIIRKIGKSAPGCFDQAGILVDSDDDAGGVHEVPEELGEITVPASQIQDPIAGLKMETLLHPLVQIEVAVLGMRGDSCVQGILRLFIPKLPFSHG